MPHDFCSDDECKDDSEREYSRPNPSDPSETCAGKNAIMDYMEVIIKEYLLEINTFNL